jgi:hypothetical protein
VGVVCHHGYRAVPLVPIDKMVNTTTDRSLGQPVAYYVRIKVQRSAGYVAKSNITRSPSLVTHRPSKSARSPLGADYSPKNSFQGACNRPPVMYGGYGISASMVFPACESRWGATHDALDVRVVPNSLPQGCRTCSGNSLKVPVSGKLQINKESRPARLKVAYKV